MASTSYIRIDKQAVEQNLDFIRSVVGENTRISAVVKGNAYGHGVSNMIPLLQSLGINHFSVFSSAEAREVCKYLNESSSLMIMGYIQPEDLPWILKNGVEFYVSDQQFFDKVLEYTSSTESTARIHLDFETGMYRTGLTAKEIRYVLKCIKENRKYITIAGVSSHFAGAESVANLQRIKKQLALFRKRIRMLSDVNLDTGIRHIASSAATINYPESHFDMVRTGILIYGYWPTRETRMSYILRMKNKKDPLKRVINWYTRVMQVKDVPEGAFIGYGLNYQAYHDMKIMVVPVGYCNGFSRSLSNNGHVIVNGMRSPVIGIVNMNMVICNITEIPDVKIGDEITLVGEQGDAEITFSSFADMNNTLNYEILARLPENIERVTV